MVIWSEMMYSHPRGEASAHRVGNRHHGGRWGGEEFLVICPACSLSDAAVIAETIRLDLMAPPFPRVGTVTASLGVAQRATNEPLDRCLSRADSALYALN